MTHNGDFDYSCKCPNVTLFFKFDGNRPLKNATVSITGATKRVYDTNLTGSVSYFEDAFQKEGSAVIEYENGTKNVSWTIELPTEPGTYTIPLSIWSNEMDDSKWLGA